MWLQILIAIQKMSRLKGNKDVCKSADRIIAELVSISRKILTKAIKWPRSSNLIKGKRGHFVAKGYVSVKAEITFNAITNGYTCQQGTTRECRECS